jgi:hypothetical protein
LEGSNAAAICNYDSVARGAAVVEFQYTAAVDGNVSGASRAGVKEKSISAGIVVDVCCAGRAVVRKFDKAASPAVCDSGIPGGACVSKNVPPPPELLTVGAFDELFTMPLPVISSAPGTAKL